MLPDSTLARILPHMPWNVQQALVGPGNLAGTIGSVPAGDEPIHIGPDSLPASHNRLKVDVAAKLARRCATEDTLRRLSSDRRAGVREALADNPNLPADVAGELFQSLTDERDGRARWAPVMHLLDRLITLGGGNALTLHLPHLESYTVKHGPVPKSLAGRLLRNLSTTELSQALEDGKLPRVLGRSPIGVLQLLSAEIAADSLICHETVVAALRAEPACSGTAGNAGGRFNSSREAQRVAHVASSARDGALEDTLTPDELNRAIHTISMIDPDAAGSLLRRLARRGERSGEWDHLDAVHMTPQLLLAAASACARRGDTYPIRAAAVRTLAAPPKPNSRAQTLADLAVCAHSLTLDEGAAEELVRTETTFGATLLVVLDQLSSSPHPQLAERFDSLDIPSLIMADEHSTRAAQVEQLAAKLIRTRSRGDGAVAARLLLGLVRHGESSWTIRRRIELAAAFLIADGTVPLADLAVIDGGITLLSSVAHSTAWPDGLGGVKSRPRTGHLAAVPHQRRVELLAAALETHRYGDDTLTRLLRPWLRQNKLLVDAVIRSSSIRDFLAGKVGQAANSENEMLLVTTCLNAPKAQRALHLEEIISAVKVRLAGGHPVAWINLLAEKVTVEEIRSRGAFGIGAVEAALLTSQIGDAPAVWQASLALIDSWEGTIAELADTARAL